MIIDVMFSAPRSRTSLIATDTPGTADRFGMDPDPMTHPKPTTGPRAWLAILALLGMMGGCKGLAPGILPIPVERVPVIGDKDKAKDEYEYDYDGYDEYDDDARGFERDAADVADKDGADRDGKASPKADAEPAAEPSEAAAEPAETTAEPAKADGTDAEAAAAVTEPADESASAKEATPAKQVTLADDAESDAVDGSTPAPFEVPELARPKVPTRLGQSGGVGLIPVAADSDRYVARQVPQNYTVPPGSGSAYQPPPTYQPPTIPSIPTTAPPTTAFPPAGSLPPPSAYQPAGPQPQMVPTPSGMMPQSPPQTSLPMSPDMPMMSSPDGGVPLNPYFGAPNSAPAFVPNTQYADLELTGVPARTGRIMVGGSVNSDAGVMGQLTLDERNFDITRWPTSFQDFASGTAFRGAGQTFRIEAVPGSVFKRYMVSFSEPNLLGFMPLSLGVSGYLFDRRFLDWDEERLGGRVGLGYRVTPELSLTAGITGQNVKIQRPRVTGLAALDDVVGDNEMYIGELRLTHDTRNSPFQPTEGHFFEVGYDAGFGKYDFGRVDVENRNYMLLSQRADGSGKQTLSLSTRVGYTSEDTPIFENYFAGGYSTMRGFDFRGASPVEVYDDGVNQIPIGVGGRFQWLNSLEYMFPITADDAFRGVAFVDFGTVEKDIRIYGDNFRVAPGLGLRVAIPMLGPAPLAFDFAYPVTKAEYDQRRIFSFYMSALR